MISEKTIPFTFQGWDSIDMLFNSYYEARFVKDFGVFKEGEHFSSISVDYSKGIIQAYNKEGTEVIKEQEYIALAV